jgi:hypothetical protein
MLPVNFTLFVQVVSEEKILEIQAMQAQVIL